MSGGFTPDAGTKIQPKSSAFIVERKFLHLVPPEILAHAPPTIRCRADKSLHPQVCTSCGRCDNQCRFTSPPARCAHRFGPCKTTKMKTPEVVGLIDIIDVPEYKCHPQNRKEEYLNFVKESPGIIRTFPHTIKALFQIRPPPQTPSRSEGNPVASPPPLAATGAGQHLPAR